MPLSLPNNFIHEIVFPENLVEHDFDVVAGVPVAVVIKAAGLFEDAGELHAARAHVVNVSPGVLVAVFKGALLPGLAPIVGLRLSNHARTVGQLGELFQIVAAINDAGVEEGRWTTLTLDPSPIRWARDFRPHPVPLPSDGRGCPQDG